MEPKKYHAALALTGALRDTSIEKFYQKLDLESQQKQRWYKNRCYYPVLEVHIAQ